MPEREGGIEERISRIERRLEKMMRMLEDLEQAASGDPEARMMLLIALRALSYQRDALGAAKWVLDSQKRLRQFGMADQINRAILEVLATRGPMSISELTRKIRELRGSASRRIVAERLVRLAEAGFVTLLGGGRGKVYRAKMGTREQKG